MTKGELKYLIFDKLTGGVPSTDSSLWETDLDPYIVPAINKAMREHYLEDIRLEGDKVVSQQLIQVAPSVAILFDINRQRSYSVLPWNIISLPKGRALTYVGLVSGKSFVPGQQGEQDLEAYYTKFKGSQVTYYLEGSTIYYYNLPAILKPVTVMMKALVSIQYLNDSDVIMLPPYKLIDVIASVEAFFSAQRTTPADDEEDSKDITTAKPTTNNAS